MSFPNLAPLAERMLEDKDCLPQMAGFLKMAWADKVQSSKREGRCCIDLHFDHYSGCHKYVPISHILKMGLVYCRIRLGDVGVGVRFDRF